MNQAPRFVKIAESVIFQEVHDEAVLLDMESQSYYGLDDVGAATWRLLLELGSVDLAVDRLSAIYDEDEATIRAGTVSLVQELLSAKLLIPAL